ncbi:MAG: hypothetical protein P2973_02970 [Gemmatimonadota bacterium]|nr:hypothetical protein [Gemmatimonadota bacterium]MDQ8178220.1 hypothetical protein [Gemmatimonadota bacterium]
MVFWHHRVSEKPEAAKQVSRMVSRLATENSRYFRADLWRRMRVALWRTTSGLLLRAPAISVDTNRLNRVIERTVRGLYRQIRGNRLDPNAQVLVLSDPEAVISERQKIERMLKGPNLRVVQEQVFWFTYNVAADNPRVSVWLLVFFDEYACLAVVQES